MLGYLLTNSDEIRDGKIVLFFFFKEKGLEVEMVSVFELAMLAGDIEQLVGRLDVGVHDFVERLVLLLGDVQGVGDGLQLGLGTFPDLEVHDDRLPELPGDVQILHALAARPDDELPPRPVLQVLLGRVQRDVLEVGVLDLPRHVLLVEQQTLSLLLPEFLPLGVVLLHHEFEAPSHPIPIRHDLLVPRLHQLTLLHAQLKLSVLPVNLLHSTLQTLIHLKSIMFIIIIIITIIITIIVSFEIVYATG